MAYYNGHRIDIFSIPNMNVDKSWEGIRNAVRLGLGDQLFPVDYEFETRVPDTGDTVVWRVVGHNHHKAADNRLRYTMTLETKYVYSVGNTCKKLQFDAPEAMYYAANGLEAGTYSFDWNYSGGAFVYGTYNFTLTQPISAGGQIVLGTNGINRNVTSCKISTYEAVGAAIALESNITVSSGSAGTSLGRIDASSSSNGNLNCALRIACGSNNYAQSAIRQCLNNNGNNGVWTPMTKFDRPGDYYKFIDSLPEDFLNIVQPAVIPCNTNSLYEVNSIDGTIFTPNTDYTLEDKFFLLSLREVYGTTSEGTCSSDKQLEAYKGLPNAERVKYDVSNAPQQCWLRTPNISFAYISYTINNDPQKGEIGNFRNAGAYAIAGFAPACIIA